MVDCFASLWVESLGSGKVPGDHSSSSQKDRPSVFVGRRISDRHARLANHFFPLPPFPPGSGALGGAGNRNDHLVEGKSVWDWRGGSGFSKVAAMLMGGSTSATRHSIASRGRGEGAGRVEHY